MLSLSQPNKPMNYYCNNCDSTKHESETVLDCMDVHPDDVATMTIRVCDDCGCQVEEIDPFEHLTNDEYND